MACRFAVTELRADHASPISGELPGGDNMQEVARRFVWGPGFMTTLRRVSVLVAMLLLLEGLSGSALAAPERGPKVYLLRGFMNVFSLGLDELAVKIEKRGIRAEVYNHTSWARLADEIAKDYKSGQTRPVILVGHSWGGLAVVNLVEALGTAGVPVALAVALDTTSVTVDRGNVGTFLNLYVATGRLKAGSGFRGRIINTDLGKSMPVGHFNIDKIEAVHAIVLRHIAQAVGHTGPRRPPVTAATSQGTAPTR
jgi:pimeloyl-ACP methyl ester carboxylesterase